MATYNRKHDVYTVNSVCIFLLFLGLDGNKDRSSKRKLEQTRVYKMNKYSFSIVCNGCSAEKISSLVSKFLLKSGKRTLEQLSVG